ncbi:MAG: sulfatase-like hydrolase/transferase [Flammeovirgaceae bacterium]|nr:sulfatase-like hydrolase/transferase [Flammeovirgaceae bacterium]
MFLKNTLYILVGIFFFASCKQEEKTIENSKPNIIFLFADDQSFKTIKALGNNEIKTPTLDKLVESGVTFSNTYNMGGWNGAICIASRTMMNTGRFLWRAKQWEDTSIKENLSNQTWGKMMESAGYQTYMSGKWHLKINPDSCFQTVSHIRPGMPKDTKDGYNRPLSESDTTWQPWNKKFGGFWEGEKHWSEVLKEDAVGFIENASKKDDPFFMYLAFNAPHDPRQSPRKYVDMYPVENIEVPASFQPLYPNKEEIGCGKGLRDERLAPFPRTEYSVKVNRQEYFAIISHMDDQIKQILDALEKSGEKENTYIFFSADHGLACGEHGLLGKQNMYDHSVRVPLMIIGPDIPKNKKVEHDIYVQDIMATSLELAGIEKPDYVEFKSFADLAKGQSQQGNYDEIFGCYTSVQRMIRKGGYKMIVYPEAKEILLFDLNNDPEELKNISEEEQEKVKTLFKDLLKLQGEMDDELDLQAVFPEMLS